MAPLNSLGQLQRFQKVAGDEEDHGTCALVREQCARLGAVGDRRWCSTGARARAWTGNALRMR